MQLLSQAIGRQVTSRPLQSMYSLSKNKGKSLFLLLKLMGSGISDAYIIIIQHRAMSSVEAQHKKTQLSPFNHKYNHHAKVYETQYVLKALSYALALNLNTYHQKGSVKALQVSSNSGRIAVLSNDSGAFSRSESIKQNDIILSTKGSVDKKASLYFKEKSLGLNRTHYEQKSSQLVANGSKIQNVESPSQKVMKMDQKASVSLREYLISIKNLYKEETQLSQDPDIGLIDDAFISSKKLSAAELAQRKDRLLVRQVEDWNGKSKKPRVRRQIRSLMP